MDNLKTSEEWQTELNNGTVVYDPDGWDRSNFQFSWYEEKITKEEFEKRRSYSTIVSRSFFNNN